MLGLSLYVLADTFFIANGVGKEGLIALNLALPAFNGGINAIGLLIASGIGAVYSIHIGRNEHRQGQEIFTVTFFFALMIGIILTLVGIFYSKDLVYLLGARGDMIELSNEYIKTLLIFSVAFIINNVMVCMVRNDGEPRLAMIAMLSGSLANIVLDYIFIYPMNMGMFGAALATGIAPVLSLIILSTHFIRKKNNFTFVRGKVKICKILRVIAIGIPASITEFSSGIVILLFNLVIIGITGEIGVAAYGIIANISLVFIAIFTGIGQGIQPVISTCYGAGESKKVNKTLKYGVILALALGIAFYVICLAFSDEIISAFNAEGDLHLLDLTRDGMKIYFSSTILMGINIVIITFFSSIAMPRPSLITSLLRGIILIIPALIILPALLGINGVWLTIPIAEALTLIIGIWLTLIYFRKRRHCDL
ncbi:MAG: MATE family efflux transporter [Clostridiales bacterium]|nr:MATE family efflux transporter [Clostridiales bacterium]